jgi:hypothetical protein
VAEGWRGSFTLELDNGRFFASLDARYFWSGWSAVEGRVLRLEVRDCSPDPCSPTDIEVTWSLYRDTLSLSPTRGRMTWVELVADSFSRVR